MISRIDKNKDRGLQGKILWVFWKYHLLSNILCSQKNPNCWSGFIFCTWAAMLNFYTVKTTNGNSGRIIEAFNIAFDISASLAWSFYHLILRMIFWMCIFDPSHGSEFVVGLICPHFIKESYACALLDSYEVNSN